MGATHRSRLVLLLVVCLGAVVALLPTAASADNMTLTIGSSGKLVAGVEVDIPTIVNCAPLPAPSDTGMSSIQLEQAVSKSLIAHGSGFWPTVICDGSDHAATAVVFADPSGPPFKKGQAVVTGVFLQVCTTSFPFVCDSTSGGHQVITIKS